VPRVSGFLAGLAAVAVAFHPGSAQAVVRLPPLDDCERLRWAEAVSHMLHACALSFFLHATRRPSMTVNGGELKHAVCMACACASSMELEDP